MDLFRASLSVLARFFLSLVFLISGVNQIIYWKETEKKFLNVISDWQTYTVSSEILQLFFHFLFSWAPFFLIVITGVQLLGALLLLLGKRERLGAGLLILVLIPTTFLVEHFWFSEANVRDIQFALFLRDLAILGGLIILSLRGSKNFD